MIFACLMTAAPSIAPVAGYAGGGPQNVLVVVNQASADSMALGNYYRETRGIPPFSVFAVDVAFANDYMDTATYSNQVRNPILDYLASSGLSNQIDYIVFSRDIPYRVHLGPFSDRRHSSVTSSMFYGFKSSPDAFVFGCDLATDSDHDYFQSERAFTHDETGLYISTMLNASVADGVRRQIDRSAAADHAWTTGNVYLAHSTDLARMARRARYENTEFSLRFLEAPVEGRIREVGSQDVRTNTMGYTTGAASVGSIATFDLREGSIAEHFTSLGGRLFDSPQMSILNWINNGAGGSYGTIVEPCAITNKFPQVQLYYWYARGFNLGESFYMAVQNPYQGIVIGDPLTQPYARPPMTTITGIAPHEWVSGVITVEVTGAAAHPVQQVEALDIFLNDRLLNSMTNVAPTTGNIVSAVIDGTTRSYTVEAGDTIYDAAAGLAASINSPVPPPSIPFTATAYGDRVEIVQDNLGEPGATRSFDAFTGIGSGSERTLHAHPVGTNFLEATASYLQTLRIEGSPASNDTIQVIVERLDNVLVTNEVVATSGSTVQSMMTNLIDVINSDPDLQDTTGVEMRQYAFQTAPTSRAEASFISRTNSWQSYKPEILVQITSLDMSESSESGRENTDVLSGRATLFLNAGRTNLSASHVIDTTSWPDGPHTLRAVTYDGSGTRTQGHALLPFTINNHSGTCAIIFPEHGANIALGNVVTVEVDVALSPGTVTSVQFHAHGRLVAETNAAPWTFAWDTAEQGAGRIDLQAELFGDGGERIVSVVHTIRVFMDSDGDGIPDWWEFLHFDGSTNAAASADGDTDGTTNLEEYIADSDPNDDADFFAITEIEQDNDGAMEALVFSSSTARVYRVDYLDAQLTNAAAWTAAAPPPFPGAPAETTWDTTNAPATTNAFRFFRVGVGVP